MESTSFVLALVEACELAEVRYDDLILTIAAGGYPCLPGAAPGSARRFDETDVLALYVYGRLLAFGFGALQAGEYACRVHAALRSNACARSVSIALVPNGGKRVVIEHDQVSLPQAAPSEKIAFDLVAIRQLLKQPLGKRPRT